MERPVASLQGGAVGMGQAPGRVVQRLDRQLRVEPRQRLPQRRGQRHGAVVGPLHRGGLRVDLPPVDHAPPEPGKPVERRRLNISLTQPSHSSLRIRVGRWRRLFVDRTRR